MTQQLEDEGVEKFNQSFDKLMDDLKGKTMRKQARVSNSLYRFLPTTIDEFVSPAELALDTRWPLPMALVGRRTKQGERS